MRPIVGIAMMLVLGTLLGTLGGCSKCDPWWGETPTTCRSATPVR